MEAAFSLGACAGSVPALAALPTQKRALRERRLSRRERPPSRATGAPSESAPPYAFPARPELEILPAYAIVYTHHPGNTRVHFLFSLMGAKKGKKKHDDSTMTV